MYGALLTEYRALLTDIWMIWLEFSLIRQLCIWFTDLPMKSSFRVSFCQFMESTDPPINIIYLFSSLICQQNPVLMYSSANLWSLLIYKQIWSTYLSPHLPICQLKRSTNLRINYSSLHLVYSSADYVDWSANTGYWCISRKKK